MKIIAILDSNGNAFGNGQKTRMGYADGMCSINIFNSIEEKMEILERIIHQINPGKWPEVNAMEAEFVKIETPFGFTQKKRFQMLAGGDGANTLVIERQWPSMAAMEAAYGKAMADPNWQTVVAKSGAIIKDTRYELLLVLP